jgi:hypothetical protein
MRGRTHGKKVMFFTDCRVKNFVKRGSKDPHDRQMSDKNHRHSTIIKRRLDLNDPADLNNANDLKPISHNILE